MALFIYLFRGSLWDSIISGKSMALFIYLFRGSLWKLKFEIGSMWHSAAILDAPELTVGSASRSSLTGAASDG
jgi:hypothetical protein